MKHNKQMRQTILQGSIEKQEDLTNCFAGVDAVVSCLGERLSFHAITEGTDLQRRSLPTIISTINEVKVGRFVLQSSFGVGETAAKAVFFAKNVFYSIIFKKIHDDKAIAEELLKNCDANWTVIYPVMLKKGPALTSSDLVSLETVRNIPGLPYLPFPNVAKTLVRLTTGKNRLSQKLLLTTNGGWTRKHLISGLGTAPYLFRFEVG